MADSPQPVFDKAEMIFAAGPVVTFQWVAAADWPVEYVSPNIAQFGYSPQDMISGVVPYASIVHPDDLERVAQEVGAHSEAGADYFEQEYRIVCADGRVVWTYDFTRIIRDADGTITHYVGYVMDNTRHKEAMDEQARLQQQVIDAQQEALKELSAPVIPVMERIIVMPLIGGIDSLRARDITRALLGGITEYRARIVILDITGVPLVDSGVAEHLNKTIMAARLKGARAIVTGISDAVAETIIDLGIDWQEVQTVRDLQTGLMVALEEVGISLSRQKDAGNVP